MDPSFVRGGLSWVDVILSLVGISGKIQVLYHGYNSTGDTSFFGWQRAAQWVVPEDIEAFSHARPSFRVPKIEANDPEKRKPLLQLLLRRLTNGRSRWESCFGHGCRTGYW